MYVEKTIRRLNELRLQRDFEIFFEQKIIVNGRKFHSLGEIMNLLPAAVETLLARDAEKFFSIIHGDLCLPNILAEENYKFLRLVDPRGSFGSFDIYGDWRYDLAKLFHSLEGHYDFIIEDMFTLKFHGSEIEYEISADCSQIMKIFLEVFREKLAGQISGVRLIESTLFLSMIPLHSDYLSRQILMLATGVELFESVLANL